MSANSFGQRFRITSFGESHGVAMGVIIDGCPAGVEFDSDFLNKCMERRRPGGTLTSSRNEDDIPEVLSGVYQGKTLGTPIALVVKNKDARSEEYKSLPLRAGHADDVWKSKFSHADPRGGGRSSGRETVARVMGGAVAQMFLKQLFPEFSIVGFSQKIGPYEISKQDALEYSRKADEFPARFCAPSKKDDIIRLLSDAKAEGRSYGGVAEIWLKGLPAGLGQPVFHKLKADLASAVLGIGATSGFELGHGFAAAGKEGSEYHAEKNKSEERYGGIRGGISTGCSITIRVAFKPTSSVLDVAKKGRHDPCIVPRAIPVVEAMCALVIADHVLWRATDNLDILKKVYNENSF